MIQLSRMRKAQPRITVFTATFNRCDLLPTLFASLNRQQTLDFEWIIVDDGSTDATQEVIKNFLNAPFSVRPFYQQNSGKMRAYNFAVQNALGSIFVCIDSDDYLVDGFLERLLDDFAKIENIKTVAGLGYLVQDKESSLCVGLPFPEDGMHLSYEALTNLGLTGDRQLIFKRDILLNFPFPVFEGERFITEAIVYNRISKLYEMVFYNQFASVVQYHPDGYSQNYWKIALKNPKGWRLYYQEKLDAQYSLKSHYAYVLYSLLSKQSPYAYKMNFVLIFGLVVFAWMRLYLIRRSTK